MVGRSQMLNVWWRKPTMYRTSTTQMYRWTDHTLSIWVCNFLSKWNLAVFFADVGSPRSSAVQFLGLKVERKKAVKRSDRPLDHEENNDEKSGTYTLKGTKHVKSTSIPYHPCMVRYIYLHEWLIFIVPYMDPMGVVVWILYELYMITCRLWPSKSKP